MANRVNVNITANDLTRTGLASVRRSVRTLNAQINGMRPEIRVRLDADSTRRDIRRIDRLVAGIPNNVPVHVNMNVRRTAEDVARARALIARLPNNVRVHVNMVDPPGNAITRMGRRAGTNFTRAAAGPFRSAGGVLGGILSDGLGQGIMNGFKAAGPVGMVILAGIIAGSVTLLAAALSGLLITAFGLAFVGIGAVSAFHSEKVKKQWKTTTDSMKKDFAHVGDGLIPVLDHALEKLQKMSHDFAPILKKSLEETAPATQKFVDSFMNGFKKFGANAFQPIMDAWNVFAPAFGKIWEGFMSNLGKAVGKMADLVKEHPTEIAFAIGVLLELIVKVVDLVTWLTEMWVAGMQTMGDAVGGVLSVVEVFIQIVMEMFGGIIHAMAAFTENIPGMGDAFKKADKDFQTFKDSFIGKIDTMKNKAYGLDDALNKANRKRILEADISKLQVQLGRARDDLKHTTGTKATAKVKADISNLTRQLALAQGKLAAMNGKTATAYMVTVLRTRDERASKTFKATGGVVGAAATGGVRSNMTMVGEHGPELVNLPPGSHVRSNPDSNRILDGQGSSTQATLEIKSSGRRADDMLLELLREAIHQRGGDPVRVLGGR